LKSASEISSILNKERWARCKRQSNSCARTKLSSKTKFRDAVKSWNVLRSDSKVSRMSNLNIRKNMSVWSRSLSVSTQSMLRSTPILTTWNMS
jgi:hypothetical protein